MIVTVAVSEIVTEALVFARLRITTTNVSLPSLAFPLSVVVTLKDFVSPALPLKVIDSVFPIKSFCPPLPEALPLILPLHQ